MLTLHNWNKFRRGRVNQGVLTRPFSFSYATPPFHIFSIAKKGGYACNYLHQNQPSKSVIYNIMWVNVA
jgi:hypothetical protein